MGGRACVASVLLADLDHDVETVDGAQRLLPAVANASEPSRLFLGRWRAGSKDARGACRRPEGPRTTANGDVHPYGDASP